MRPYLSLQSGRRLHDIATEVSGMAIILSLYAATLALAIWQDKQVRNGVDRSDKKC